MFVNLFDFWSGPLFKHLLNSPDPSGGMTALDSEALFEERAKSFGVTDAVYQLLKAANYSTFGRLAFCSSYQVGSNDEKPLMDALEAALGREVTAAEAPALRRLCYEASTMVMSDLK